MNTATARTNLLGLTRPSSKRSSPDLGEKPFRARQLMKWIYQRGVGDFAAMTDLGKDFRAAARRERAKSACPEIVQSQVSARRHAQVAAALEGDQAIETVFIPEQGRGTLCISTQVGCALDCRSARPAQQGFNRNLTAAEIVGQVWLANRELGYAPGGDRVDHQRRVDGHGRAAGELPQRRAGGRAHARRPRLRPVAPPRHASAPRASCRRCDRSPRRRNVALAVSLHAPNDALRNELVPINRKYPIAELLAACWHYLERQNARNVTFEYVMLDGVNDQPEHARELAALLRGRPAKVNLIPFNPFPGTRYRRSPRDGDRAFRDRLLQGRRHRDHAPHARRRHRCRLRPARRPGPRPHDVAPRAIAWAGSPW